jgi:hypothetical protein
VVSSNEVNVLRYCTSLLYLSTIFEKSVCNKVNFFWSTFTWNKVVLRSNVFRYFLTFVLHLFSHFGIDNRTSTCVWDLSFVAYL